MNSGRRVQPDQLCGPAGWTLTSIAGFSGTTSRLLERSLSVQQAARGGPGGGGARGSQRQQRRAPTTLAGGLSQGLLGLYSGVSSGVTGIVSAPLQGLRAIGSSDVSHCLCCGITF